MSERASESSARRVSPIFPTATERVIVVGAGISGLTAGFRLRQRGFDVTVLEASSATGGKMSSLRRDGYVVNRAANILPSSYAALQGLIRDVGLADQVGEADPVLGVPRDGTLRRIRASGLAMVLDGAATTLLSLRSKILLRHLVVDAVRMKSSLSYANLGKAATFDTETVAGYCRRRLNPEIQEYLVEPILRALFTSNADDVSVVDFFFAAVNFVGSGLMQYPGGIDFLGNALAAHLDVRLGAVVSQVERDADSATVTWEADGETHSERVAACVLAVSGAQVPGLYPQLDHVQREIMVDRLRYGVTYVGHFALRSRPDEASLIVPVPRSVDENLCVVTFDHNSSPHSVPPGRGLVSSYWLNQWGAARASRTDDELVAEMLPAMRKIVPGIADELVFTHVDRWDPAVVSSYPGWYAQVKRFGERIDATDRVQLAGDYLTASSTNGCAVSGELAAERVERAVFRTSTVRVAAA
jgi:oxygen-dependent protoporphyrinogen oxidase